MSTLEPTLVNNATLLMFMKEYYEKQLMATKYQHTMWKTCIERLNTLDTNLQDLKQRMIEIQIRLDKDVCDVCDVNKEPKKEDTCTQRTYTYTKFGYVEDGY